MKNSSPFIEKGLLQIQSNLDSSEFLTITKKGKFLADGIASDLFML